MESIGSQNSLLFLRKYRREDHAAVRKIFYNGMVQTNWRMAYWNIISGNSMKPFVLQICFLFTLYLCGNTFLQFVLYEALLQMLWMMLLYFAFWNYASTSLNTDMKDEDLSFWTAPDNKDFWVATFEGVVVGSVAYDVQNSILEIFRLSVDIKFRKFGIARQLMNKIEEVAQQRGCTVVRAQTSEAQKAACSFYVRVGYVITNRKVASTNPESWLEVQVFPWFHGVHTVVFDKSIQ